MTSRLLLEPEAEAEFLEGQAWYAARGPALGTAFRDAVRRVLESIEEAPQQYPIAVRDIRKARVGRFPLCHLLRAFAGCHHCDCDHTWAS